MTVIVLKPLIMRDEKIQGSSPGSSEFCGQGIKLLESALVASSKEEVDGVLIAGNTSLHGGSGGDISIYSG